MPDLMRTQTPSQYLTISHNISSQVSLKCHLSVTGHGFASIETVPKLQALLGPGFARALWMRLFRDVSCVSQCFEMFEPWK